MTPNELKQQKPAELPGLAAALRQQLTGVTLQNGGHLASNLGAVELTVALHYVFDSPRDTICFDVGHQAYVHKLLTGREALFHTLRCQGGLSGFPNPKESEHDPFPVGHSSTALSTALGLARSRDLSGGSQNIVAVVGDGAMGGGMFWEALNDLGYKKTRLIIVLNDNNMSISRNVGGLSLYLTRLRTMRGYESFKRGLEKLLRRLPFGPPVLRGLERAKNTLRYLVLGKTMFHDLGIKYLGPIDGHDTKALLAVLKSARREQYPVLVHVITQKGKGLEKAESDPSAYHGVASCAAPIVGGESFSHRFGCVLSAMAGEDATLCAITAGMAGGTGLEGFAQSYPNRFFDAGIAEQHAAGLAAGLAKGGYKPFLALYATFAQRALDQIFQEVSLSRLPVVLCLDRAGLTGEDGETHQGIYELSFLRALPGLPVYQAATLNQLEALLKMAQKAAHPLAIRYGRGGGEELLPDPFNLSWQQVLQGSGAVALVTYGTLLEEAVAAAKMLPNSPAVFSICRLDVLAADLLHALSGYKHILVAEEHAPAGSLGEHLAASLYGPQLHFANTGCLPVAHASVAGQRALLGLNAEGLARRITGLL